MEHLFFSSSYDIDKLASLLSDSLDTKVRPGETKHVLNERYFQAQLLGASIRLEENSYDYEDDYRYMVTIKRYIPGNMIVRDTDIAALARIIQHILADNLVVDVAMEYGDALRKCGPSAQDD